MVAVLLLLMCGSPMAQYLDTLRVRTAAPTVSEIHARAIEYVSEPGIGSNWGMTEAFSQLRRTQAMRLGQSLQAIK